MALDASEGERVFSVEYNDLSHKPGDKTSHYLDGLEAVIEFVVLVSDLVRYVSTMSGWQGYITGMNDFSTP
jgi:hypothetical protein